MKTLRLFSVASSLVVSIAIPAMAGVTVNAPLDSGQVSSPFKLSAVATSCSSEQVSSMGYSFDSSSDTTIVAGQSIESTVGSSSGNHILHVKAWGPHGAACVTDVALVVTAGGSIVPWNAVPVSHLDAMGGWQANHDSGGPGSSSGSMEVMSSPSISGSARRFVSVYSSGGDERYSLAFADDIYSTNFFYDAWVYVTSSASNIGNLEFDTNQTMPDGKTVMIGVQCDGYTGQWAYTVNEGSDSSPHPRWVGKSGTHCNPRSWSQYKWHHVQAYYSHDASGWITYHSVWLDGVESVMNETVFGRFDINWGPRINTQFQVDGLGSGGHTTVYLSNLSISRW